MSRRSHRRGAARLPVLVAVLMALGACASVPQGTDPVQYLDRDTGVTFMVVSRPLVFAHARTETAARVRDYATVAGASIDRNGRIDYVLIVYLWSTVDPRNVATSAMSEESLILAADERRIVLRPFADGTQPIPPIDRPPVRHFTAALYRCDRETLRYLGAVRHLSLLRYEGRDSARFELWDDQRASLAALVGPGG